MYHLYTGNGTVKDISGVQRAIHATMLISDQLMTAGGGGPGKPVNLPSGQRLSNGQYQFIISHWHVIVDKIGIFFGQSGSIYLEFDPNFPVNPGITAREWGLVSDAARYEYDWLGKINFLQGPNNWVNPLASDYGHLFSKMDFYASNMGQTIRKLFSSDPNFVITRHP